MSGLMCVARKELFLWLVPSAGSVKTGQKEIGSASKKSQGKMFYDSRLWLVFKLSASAAQRSII